VCHATELRSIGYGFDPEGQESDSWNIGAEFNTRTITGGRDALQASVDSESTRTFVFSRTKFLEVYTGTLLECNDIQPSLRHQQYCFRTLRRLPHQLINLIVTVPTSRLARGTLLSSAEGAKR